MNFSAVILAGGKSSRMGRDKAFLEMDGQSLLARQISTVRQIGASDIFISGRREINYSAFNLPVLYDHFPDSGALAGIHSALVAIQNPLLLVIAIDLPYLMPETLTRMKREIVEEKGIIPLVNCECEPLAAFYSRSSLPLSEQAIIQQANSVRRFASQCVESNLATFHPIPDMYAVNFKNCNTPTDILTS